MKKAIAVLLSLIFVFAACGGDDGIVGTWESVENGHEGVFVFNEDGTGSVSIDGVSMDTKWSVVEDKYLTVTMEVAGTTHKAFDGVEFAVKDGKLTITTNDEQAVFTRKK